LPGYFLENDRPAENANRTAPEFFVGLQTRAMARITVVYLRSNYPALRAKTDSQLESIIAILNNEMIETISDLGHVSRDSLLPKLPALALDALKPELKQQWYCVAGAIIRPKTHAGARRELFKLASSAQGLYPEGFDSDCTFETGALSGDPDRRYDAKVLGHFQGLTSSKTVC